jgi:hypothetical protein
VHGLDADPTDVREVEVARSAIAVADLDAVDVQRGIRRIDRDDALVDGSAACARTELREQHGET